MNIGKNFEKSFQDSSPQYFLTIRFPDQAQSFSPGEKTRFSRKNPCDFFAFDTAGRIFYALELKTKAGKSISFERTKEDKGDIHYHQIMGLKKFAEYNWTCAGFVIWFRAEDKTIFLSIGEFLRLIEMIDKKSFNLTDLVNNNISFVTIEQKKLIKNYRWNIDKFLEDIRNEYGS